jgi:energy-coupling factor transporter transmembrane protein EcfT
MVLLIFWGIALCLAMLLIDDKKVLYGSFILILIGFAMFFNNEPFYYLIGLIILLIAFRLAVWKIRKEEKIQVNLNFWRIWKRGLPILITALILLVALVYYFSPGLERMEQKEIKIPRKVFDFIIEPLAGLIEKRLPQEIESLDVEADKILTPEQLGELKQQYNISLIEGDTIRDFLYELVDFQLNNVITPYKKFIPIGLAIALFFALRAVAMIYMALVIMLSWVFLKLLILLRFIKVEIETKEVETIKL